MKAFNPGAVKAFNRPCFIILSHLLARRSDRGDSAKRCEQKKTTTRGHLTEMNSLYKSLADEDPTVSVVKGVLVSHTANVHTLLKKYTLFKTRY